MSADAVKESGNDAWSRYQSMRVEAPRPSQKLGWFSLCCLILNRTVGSGIFVTTHVMLLATDNPIGTFFMWFLGGIVSLLATVVWLEFGLTLPRYILPDGRKVPAPMSGGEKNYIEFLLRTKRCLGTCLFGIPFIALGNLAGNAIVFGKYFLIMVNPSRDLCSHDRMDIVIAFAVILVSCSVHIFSRRGGIMISNIFAVLKVIILLVFIVWLPAAKKIPPSEGPFPSRSSLPSDYAYSLLYVLYSFSGFEQPFYVLSEAKRPHKTFPKITLGTMGFIFVVYLILNIIYISLLGWHSVPSKIPGFGAATDMASFILDPYSDTGLDGTRRGIAALICVSVAGNIIVQTFTAARVKQEIAKEGILPRWLWKRVAQSMTSLSIKLRSAATQQRRRAADDAPFEQVPAGGLVLHFCMSMFLVAVTAWLDTRTAFTVLAFLYGYVIVVIVVAVVSGGLCCLYLFSAGKWVEQPRGFKPWGGPGAALVVFVSTMFIIIGVFTPMPTTSPFRTDPPPEKAATCPDYLPPRHQYPASQLLPAVGLAIVSLGFVYWLFLQAQEIYLDREIHVRREAHIQQNIEGDWVQRYEIITVTEPESEAHGGPQDHVLHESIRAIVMSSREMEGKV